MQFEKRDGTQTTADFIAQLTRRLYLSLESKGVVTRELIEGDRLASCEPLHVIRQQARFPLAVETLEVDQSIGGPFPRGNRGTHQASRAGHGKERFGSSIP